VNKDINTAPVMMDEYDYQLPDERIAKYPLEQRDQSRLLIYQHGQISEDRFDASTDYLPENALLICATNHKEMIDTALIRRFQIRIKYSLPSKELLDSYYNKLLAVFPENIQTIKRDYNLSFAEAKDYTYTLIKSMLLDELEQQEKAMQYEQ